ncbi:hypothetical protein HPP92_003904 [Vanilla planifolia]|uniref:Dof-type domain-containing protein n=1 Tax=Vanilla planifolia TaxID=51239 RepID=A0A835SGI2_VANPL|nr:hypothetical protein HPP92_003904 [Vanilla planifolia]
MDESRDRAIKLFGKMIQLPVDAAEGARRDEEKVNSSTEAFSASKTEVATLTSHEEEKNEPNSSKKEEKYPSSPAKNRSDSTNSIRNAEKILPCPRCSSKETKFCYYNNYKVNQPRHFCKNCHRYWTAGGSVRNIPVGSGRRKTKCSVVSLLYSNFADPELADPIQHMSALPPNQRVLCFGSGATLRKSIASALHLVGKSAKNADNGEDLLAGSSVTAMNSNEDRNRAAANARCNGYLPNGPCFSGTPWPYTWSHPPPFPIPFSPATSYCNVPWQSPAIGKHSREEENSNFGYSEKGSEHERVAKCSIWVSIGFKNEKSDPFSGDGEFFKGIQSNNDLKAKVLRANPAALSRSMIFQENHLSDIQLLEERNS